MRKSDIDTGFKAFPSPLLKPEKDLLLLIELYEVVLKQAADDFDPSVIATYLFQLAQSFNSFYAALSIGNAESEEKKQLRLKMSSLVATIIASGMNLLGIKVPEKM